MHVGEAVDLLAGDVRSSGHQVLVLGVLSQLVGSSEGVERGTDYRVIDRIFDLLAEHPEVEVQLAQGFNVLVLGHHNRNSILSFK